MTIKVIEWLAVFTCLVLWGSASPSLGNGVGDARALSTSGSLPADIFKRCAFGFSDTPSLSRSMNGTDNVDTNEKSCSISLDYNSDDAYAYGGSSFWVIMTDRAKISGPAAGGGFYEDKERRWKFKGNPMGITFLSFKKLSLEEKRQGDDLTLIGRQMERSKNQVGDVLVSEGVHILRITPLYIVNFDFSFSSQAPKIKRDLIIEDMIKLVDSVHPTTPAQSSP